MKLISKHLPLLALALVISSTELGAEELPFKVGDEILIETGDSSFPIGGSSYFYCTVTDIKGRWVEVINENSFKKDPVPEKRSWIWGKTDDAEKPKPKKRKRKAWYNIDNITAITKHEEGESY